MTVKQLEASVRNQGSLVIIDLFGEINSEAEEALNNAYGEASKKGSDVILLNFQEVDYINSTGIALIVSLLAQARRSNRRLAVYGLSDHYEEIFQITRLSDFMTLYPDETSALAELGENG